MTSTPLAPRELHEIADGVHVATAEIWTSITTVVVSPDGRALVVDPGITVEEVESLATALSRRGWRVTAGFSTHPHWDHVLWSRSLGDVPRWACPTAVRAQERSLAEDLTKVEREAPGHDLALFGRLTPLPSTAADSSTVGASSGTVRLPWPAAPGGTTASGTATTAHGGPGAGEPVVLVVEHQAHAPGHGALVLPGAGVIVVGDMLSDLEVPLLDLESPDPLGDYRAGLDALEHAISEHGVHTLVPGHGHVCTGSDAIWERFGADRTYLDDLEVAAGDDTDDTGASDDLRVTGDPRVTGEWVVGEHRRQLAHLRRARSA
ncbi:MBL fold metallo-hydrolase [Oerskovia enterophila]|uniref:Metallo-beta-lactamase superfamily protein n=1 Tax=Oerskovia enterophila TaxID=43678 RepID=A0A163SQN0_9CELL|nr:MBL fold metallo-hydrolase [Oerskovia enterophila]KZM36669.1 metallo-beta-lactamase superfamily protein [Oerskovia enterophila]OCI29706.1 metallo-beta-lactamase superfamily protein [Oerskovia enterophila]